MTKKYKTYGISDTVLLGKNVEETCTVFRILKDFHNHGNKIFFLSNRPSKWRHLNARINDSGSLEYFFEVVDNMKGSGYQINIFKDGKLFLREQLPYNYSIYANGFGILNEKDLHVPYCSNFLSMEQLGDMAEIFESMGYKSANYCFNKGDLVYKYFRPEEGSSEPNYSTYGMQCGAPSPEEGQKIIELVEANVDSIYGVLLNGKPCFYHTNNHKERAITQGLIATNRINPDNTTLFLGDVTEKGIIEKYGDISYQIGNEKVLSKASKYASSLYCGLYENRYK